MVFGVYVHIPFCAHRCDYCDFATWTDRAHLVDQYVEALVRDLDTRRDRGELRPATSVFFGGGTPSLLAAPALARVLDGIPRAEGAEVTVECNPDSVDAAKLAVYRRAGVNRISLGVQSMQPHVLVALNRTHDPANVERAVEAARGEGIARLNLDLIYGTPGESVDDWTATLDAALALEPDHVSAYALTVEPGTPLGRAVSAGTRSAPDDDDQADKYLVADDRLTAAGLSWYEISNWARPGSECRHNLLYWTGGDYVAIGCAGHGSTAGRRWWNVRTPERYVAAIASGETPEAGAERLEAGPRAEEAFGLALRTRSGAPPPPGAGPEAAALVASGLLERDGARLVLTRRGRLLATEVTTRLALSAPGWQSVDSTAHGRG
jgi:oxygen-independent coproporphyrinogen-3 oxidase